MVRILKVAKLAERKKLLLLQSDLNRHALRLQVASLRHSMDQIKKRFTIASISSVAISGAASVIAMVAARRKENGKTGLLAKILSGISLFNQLKGWYHKFKPPADDSAK